MRRFLFVLAALAAVFIAGGCADPEVMAEVLQQKQDQKIYTRYNLWYLNPAEISCLNIQQGSFLPLARKRGRTISQRNSAAVSRARRGERNTV